MRSAAAAGVAALFAPISVRPLVYLRVTFGLIMLWEVFRYFGYGWIERYYMRPTFYFTYYGFDWLRPWPGDLMYWHFIGLGALAICIALGFAYRLVMPLFFVGFTYVFLLDQTNYLNHFYLISLVSLMMCFLPANRALSLDARIWPGLRRDVVPAWTLYAVRLQLGLAYVFGGIAKLNGDWLAGEPMRTWLRARTDFPLIGPYFTEEWMVMAFSYGGLLIDLFAIPLLFFRPTRWFALAALVSFHLINARLFSIGIFPWFMLATLALFLPLAWWTPRANERPQSTGIEPKPRARRLIVAALGVYFLWQLLMPLRHFLYPGNVSWTEQGHNFSWHMKLRDKEGEARFTVVNADTGYRWDVDPDAFLTRRQADKMPQTPDMILQFAHMLADEWRRDGYDNIEVYVDSWVSLNARPRQRMIDPDANLAAVERNPFQVATWILPLTEP